VNSITLTPLSAILKLLKWWLH